jgi:hypothetical protein
MSPIARVRRTAVEIGTVARRVVLCWAVAIVATGVGALAFGWHEGGSFSLVANLVLWPGSAAALIVIGALPIRGGALVAAGCGTLIGITCASVVALLPDARLPIAPGEAHRWYYIVEALGIAPAIGLILGMLGVGIRTMVVEAAQSIAAWAQEVAAASALDAVRAEAMAESLAEVAPGELPAMAPAPARAGG